MSSLSLRMPPTGLNETKLSGPIKQIGEISISAVQAGHDAPDSEEHDHQ